MVSVNKSGLCVATVAGASLCHCPGIDVTVKLSLSFERLRMLPKDMRMNDVPAMAALSHGT